MRKNFNPIVNIQPMLVIAAILGLFIFSLFSGKALAETAAQKTGDMNPSQASASNGNPVSICRDPIDLPAALPKRGAKRIRVDLETVEVTGPLGDDATYDYWTFNGKVPGPFIRARVGDTVEVHLKNPKTSFMEHSVDFHAASGPAGGGAVTQTPPGEEKSFSSKALKPGVFIYHCGTPVVAQHIASGMYGIILVEPKEGLSRADHEFYVMQGEVYTAEPFATTGHLTLGMQKVLDEEPTYYVFNGSLNALTREHPLRAKVGEKIRIFLGNAGPNKISSFHVIGQILDRVYNLGSLASPPLRDVQTVLVPPGGAAMVEFTPKVPGKYLLVDHAISRLQKGLAGWLLVEGPSRPEIFYAPKAK